MNRVSKQNNDNYTFELIFQEDRNIFDVSKNHKEFKKNISDNLLSSSIIITSGTIGVSVLYMWSQIYLSGLILGILQIIFSAFLTYLSSLALILSAQKVKRFNYISIAEETMGKYKNIIDVVFFIGNWGTTVALKYQMNLILIEGFRFLNTYFNLYLSHIFINNDYFWIFFMDLILFGFFFLKSIEPLKIFNYIGIFSILLINFIMIFLYFFPLTINFEVPKLDFSKMEIFKPNNFFNTLPYFIGAFCIHPFILDVYVVIKPNTNNNFKKVWKMSLIKISAIYLSCSIFGYLCFYNNPTPFYDTLKKFNRNNLIVIIPNYLFFVSLLGTHIIMNKALKDQVMSTIGSKLRKGKNIIYYIASAITWIQTFFLLWIIIYKIEPSLILNYLSLVTNTPISIVFPFLFFVISHKNEAGGYFRNKYIKINTLLIILGTIIYSLLIIHTFLSK